jgi:hypothetical protein
MAAVGGPAVGARAHAAPVGHSVACGHEEEEEGFCCRTSALTHLTAPRCSAPPPQAFNIPHFVRIVITAPLEVLGEALDRTAAFCARRRAAAVAAVAAATGETGVAEAAVLAAAAVEGSTGGVGTPAEEVAEGAAVGQRR